ncbi:Pam3-gp28 family putative phage holin [Methylorubrum aminovorans]
MNAAQIASALRLAIVFFGGFAVARGWLTQEQVDFASDATLVTAVVGGVAAIIAAVYGIWIRRPAGIVAQAAKLPEVGMIQASPSLAHASRSGKVQPVTAEELRDADRMTRG